MSFAQTSKTLADVYTRISARSDETRRAYLDRVEEVRRTSPPRRKLSCGNLAHAAAACSASEKMAIATGTTPNLGIVTSYNDMLSAHQPFATYPDLIKEDARTLGLWG
jgi:phosphogluconate dehydratase